MCTAMRLTPGGWGLILGFRHATGLVFFYRIAKQSDKRTQELQAQRKLADKLENEETSRTVSSLRE